MTLLQACLNGNRPRSDHPAVPITAAELAEDAARALAAGARELHVHPRGPDGNDTVEPAARVGLEDTIVLPDGTSARDNAELVAEAARRVELLS